MGGLMIAVSMCLFVTNDSIMRSLQEVDNPFGVNPLPLPLIIAIRGTMVAAFLIILARAMGVPLFPKGVLGKWNLGRAGVEATITVLFLSALPHIPLAAAETLISANPIFLVLMGIFFFGERVGWRRWLAIALGFGGIVMVSYALADGGFDAEKFRWWAAPYCLIAAVFVAVRDVFTRYVGDSLPPVTVALSSALAVMLLGWVWGFSALRLPDGGQLVALLASAILVVGAYLSAVFAVRLGTFAVIGPLRFVSLVVAFGLGILLFGDPFSWLGLAGAILIVGSAVWIVLRERAK